MESCEMAILSTSAFSKLPWHDSELLSLRIGNGSSDRSAVTLDVDFHLAGVADGRTEVGFNEVRGIYVDVDLLAKELCGNQIASGHCTAAEESKEAFIDRLQERFDLYRGETLEGLFLFRIELIHPGGVILVLARSCSTMAASALGDTVSKRSS
jgi:hypothetical protein